MVEAEGVHSHTTVHVARQLEASSFIASSCGADSVWEETQGASSGTAQTKMRGSGSDKERLVSMGGRSMY